LNSFDEANGRPDYSDLDPEDRPDPDFHYQSSRVDVEFIGANPNPEIVSEEMMPDYLNYYLAYTPVEGITRVKQFNKITYKNLYPNIDLVLIAMPEQNPRRAMAYDFVVHPGGSLSDIKYRYHGNSGQILHPNGGEIMVSTARDGDDVLVRVTDTGAGIPPDVQPHILEPYFSTKKSGTGLGLPTVRRIVEEHGGSLSFSSTLGKGTQFTLRLPARPRPAEERR